MVRALPVLQELGLFFRKRAQNMRAVKDKLLLA